MLEVTMLYMLNHHRIDYLNTLYIVNAIYLMSFIYLPLSAICRLAFQAFNFLLKVKSCLYIYAHELVRSVVALLLWEILIYVH